MLKLLIRLFVIILVVMGLYIASKKSDVIMATVSKQFGVKYKAVAGAHTSRKSEDSLMKTVQNTLGTVEKQVMQIKLGDIASAAGQLKAVGSQLNAVKNSVMKQVGASK